MQSKELRPTAGGASLPAIRRALRRPLLAAAALSIALNLLLLVPALYTLQVFDRVLVSRSHETLLVLLTGVGLALGAMLVLDHLRSRLQGVVGNMVGDALMPVVSRRVLTRLAHRPENDASAATLRDVTTLRQLFATQGLPALFDAPWLLVYVAVVALAHPWLGAAAALAALLMIGLAVLNDLLTRREIEDLQRAASGAQRWIEHAMRNAEVTQALGMGDGVLTRWRALNHQAAELQRPTARCSVAMAAAARTLRQGVQVGMLTLGAYLVITQRASPGVMVATTILLGRALAPVEQIVGSWRVLAEGRAACRRIGALFADEQARPETMPLPAPQGRLAVQGVALRAPGGERLLLAGVSLELEPGESLAVVGASGAGKSTLARVLIGLWRPSAGTVRLDHADLAQRDREEVGPTIGYVPQDVELFAGTVADNIARLGQPDAQRVVAAAQRARIHEMVLSLPHGYDTVIDPQGAVITPGQRQRIALARALYGDPKLVVLDEPNANLDGAGEAALAEVLRSLKGAATVVVVTHRTNLAQHVDKMLVLEGGRVAHLGPRGEVMAKLQPTAAGGQEAPVPSGHVVALARASGGMRVAEARP